VIGSLRLVGAQDQEFNLETTISDAGQRKRRFPCISVDPSKQTRRGREISLAPSEFSIQSAAHSLAFRPCPAVIACRHLEHTQSSSSRTKPNFGAALGQLANLRNTTLILCQRHANTTETLRRQMDSQTRCPRAPARRNRCEARKTELHRTRLCVCLLRP
jgi:hypothetical protein